MKDKGKARIRELDNKKIFLTDIKNEMLRKDMEQKYNVSDKTINKRVK